MAIPINSEDFISVIAFYGGNQVCVIDQVPYDTYKQRFEIRQIIMDNRLVFHFTGMKHEWPKNWVMLPKDEWEFRYGKVRYP